MKKYIIYIVLLISSIILAYALYYGIRFNDATFEQFYYSAIFVKGTGVNSFLDMIIIIVLETVLIFSLFVLMMKFKEKLKIKIKNKDYHLFKSDVKFTIIVLSISFILLANSVNLIDYIMGQVKNSDFYLKHYVDPRDVEITFDGDENNLIYIFLESFESGLVSTENGGFYDYKVVPNLENLALENTNFSPNDKLGGAYVFKGNSWTMSAMLGQTSGITMNLPLGSVVYDEATGYMENLVTIGDILNENGYQNYLMIGSDGDFAGRKDYFQDHGDYEVFDYYTAIEEGKIDEDYFVFWGYEDLRLFEYAKEKIVTLEEPFNFTMLTVDTHFTDGYLDSECAEPFEQAYLNAYNCSDKKVNEFIEWIKLQDFYENTTIVIVGDHNSMQVIDKDMENFVFNTFINSKVETDFTKNRLFSTLDMFPTTLAAMGATIEGDRLGLGVNLFSSELTLIEQYGYDFLNEELQNKSNFYNDKFLY